MDAYSGIGSRETPSDVMGMMTKIARQLQDLLILRSGHAPGADTAFEQGITNGNMEIYIPWKGFGGSTSNLYESLPLAYEIASQYHPTWKTLRDPVKRLMSRNVHQVLGPNLDSPAKFVLCWTPDGAESHKTRSQKTGGTGQAISIASENNVPVINMKNFFWKDRLLEIVSELREEYE
jgi:hypothetical protein